MRRNPSAHQAHEDAYVSLHDAFDAVKRQLEDYARKRRGQIKTHDTDELHRAKVLRLFPEDGYGFLITPDAREIYFTRNALNGIQFEHLHEGTEVSFIEEMGNEGPQAVRVLTGKHAIGM